MFDQKFITYVDYNLSDAQRFFEQKRNALTLFKQNSTIDENEKRLNQILSNAQKDLTSLTNEIVTEEALKNAIQNAMNTNSALSGDIEKMASSMNIAFFNEANEKARDLREVYEKGYEEFEFLTSSVLKSGRVLVNKNQLIEILNNLNPTEVANKFKEVANPLGWIGELSGLVLLNDIANELLESSFKNIPNVQVELVNTGSFFSDQGSRLTTDNILIFRSDGKVIYQLNLSNKLNTAYKANSKTTKRAIKLRTTSVNAFLNEHQDDWPSPIFNIISYHWDTSKKSRVDYLNSSVGSIARQTLGLQILLDHIYGTKETFSINEDIFKDEVQLIAYGTQIIASNSVLKNALFNKFMKDKNKYRMATINRKDWFQDGNEQGETYIYDEFDAQRRILKFELIYSQTLSVDDNLTF